MKRTEIEQAKMDALNNIPLLKEKREDLIVAITSAYTINNGGKNLEEFVLEYMDNYIKMVKTYDKVLSEKERSTERALKEYASIIDDSEENILKK